MSDFNDVSQEVFIYCTGEIDHGDVGAVFSEFSDTPSYDVSCSATIPVIDVDSEVTAVVDLDMEHNVVTVRNTILPDNLVFSFQVSPDCLFDSICLNCLEVHD